jgi:mannose-6-phosphate isomerase-like protein (cupin superfamily)
MHYRDLIPDRQGGRFIASHIRIAQGGPVPDYAHFHRIRFQMIFCYKGWVRVVYEGQGEPFVLQAGDCVLQPPLIRHRVLESSPGLEVVELGCPAEHETWADHKISLPGAELQPGRDFDGQNFVRHIAANTPWGEWRMPGFEARNTGIDQATHGLAGVNIVRASSGRKSAAILHQQELLFLFVLQGSLHLDCDGQGAFDLTAGDCCAIPQGFRHRLGSGSSDLEFLEVTLPATFDSV